MATLLEETGKTEEAVATYRKAAATLPARPVRQRPAPPS